MPKVKKRKKTPKDYGADLVVLIADLMKLLETQRKSKVLSKNVTNNITSTLTDILMDNEAFRLMLADPKSDLTGLEPIIRNMLKKKNGRRKS
jgi:hypothetical protein